MSLFRMLGMGGDFDDDNFFGDPTREMNAMLSNHFSMMSPLMESPFSLMGPGIISPFANNARRGMFGMDLLPLDGGFANPLRMLDTVGRVAVPPAQMFYSSNVVTMTNGPDGRPEVYQASSSVRSGPGGVKETMKSVSDSRSGLKKMQIGHHIGERGHVIERERNYRSGTAEERQEFINIEEDEADDFESNWQNLASRNQHQPHYINHRQPRLALPSSSGPPSRRTQDGSQSRSHYSEYRKKRPHESDSNYGRRKNFRCTQPSSEPVPVVEVPDSDSEESPPKSPRSRSGPTIVEVLD